MLNLRLRFSKLFNARYISHLDLMRCFSRAVKQSGIDAWYTEGFNPHLYITFALPLSLGQESICEVADLKLNDDLFDSYIAEKINQFLPFGIEVYAAGQARQKVADIGWACYDIELSGGPVLQSMVQAAAELEGREAIIINKTTKKGPVETDIRPLISSLTATISGDHCLLNTTLAAGPQVSLNPQLLLDELFRSLKTPPDHQLIKRVNILDRQFNSFE